jgi:hypothetical protein
MTPGVSTASRAIHQEDQYMNGYTGQLYYDDTNEHLHIVDFIVRGDQVAFDLQIVNGDGRHWSASAVAHQVDGRRFYAGNVPLKRMNRDADVPWNFTFVVETIDDGLLYIEGHVETEGQRYEFSGDLEKKC